MGGKKQDDWNIFKMATLQLWGKHEELMIATPFIFPALSRSLSVWQACLKSGVCTCVYLQSHHSGA